MGVDEGEGIFFSLQTSSFTTDKSDGWKPIKKKKKKNPTHRCPAPSEKFLSSPHPFAATVGC